MTAYTKDGKVGGPRQDAGTGPSKKLPSGGGENTSPPQTRKSEESVSTIGGIFPIVNSFGIGAILSLFLGFVVWGFLSRALHFLIGVDLLGNMQSLVIVGGSAAAIFFSKGITKVPVASFAVLVFFGKRCREPLPGMRTSFLTEGYWWTIPIPFLMEVEVTYAADQFAFELKAVKLLVKSADDGDGIITLSESGLVSVLASVTVIGRITNPVSYIEKQRAIQDALDDLIGERLRIALSQQDIWSVLTGAATSSALNNQILNEVKELSANNGWGLDIEGISIPQIMPESGELLAAYTRITIEGLEKASETTEIDHMIGSVARIVAGTKLTPTEALRAFNIAQGKLKPEELGLRGGAGRGRGGGAVIVAGQN
jgi:regulator of protease activity HflC (stomatin/prohibitin superfamily)